MSSNLASLWTRDASVNRFKIESIWPAQRWLVCHLSLDESEDQRDESSQKAIRGSSDLLYYTITFLLL